MKNNLKLYLLLGFIAAAHLAACIPFNKARPEESISQNEPVLMGKVRVYDGDSIFFGRIEVRLDAIDAPEHDQACLDSQGRFWPCGIVSRDTLRAMIGNSMVRCVLSGKDKYRRLLGICSSRGHDVNEAMVKEGYAIAYHHFSERYAAQESLAREKRLGIWQDVNFTEPYFCRHFEPGHTCYEYDYALGTGKVAQLPLIGKSHAVGAPD